MPLRLLPQHSLNALHVMAFLTRRGLSRPRALRHALQWERITRPFLYCRMGVRHP
jgi:hypothetical protein